MGRELSEHARAAIRAGLAAEAPPSPAHRARLRRSVLVRAAAGGALLAGSGVAKASAVSLFATVASSVGVGFGAGLVLLGAAQLTLAPTSSGAAAHGERAVVSARSLAPARAIPIAPGPVIGEVPPEPSAALAHRLEFAPPRTPVSAVSGSPLRAELDLMAQVQEALRDGRGTRALRLIADYDARYPSGVLERERLAAEVFAACLVGDHTRAQRAAQLYLAQDRSSALASRVEKSCQAQAERR